MKSKLVYFVCGYPWSEVVIQNRVRAFSRFFNSCGFEFLVFNYGSCLPPDLKGFSLRGLRYKGAGTLFRLFAEMYNFFSSFLYVFVKSLFFARPDVILVTVPSMFFVFFGFFYRLKSVVICDLRDLTWEYLLNGRNDFLSNCLRKIFTSALNKYDFIFVTNDFECKILVKSLVNECKIHVVPNGVNLEKFQFIVSRVAVRSNLDGCSFVYSGNLGDAQNLEIFLQACSMDTSGSFNLRFVGDGVARRRLGNLVETQGVSNVSFSGFLEWSDVVSELESADVLVFSLGGNFSLALPSKVYEYLLFGKPIIFVGPKGACSDFLKNARGCYHVDIGEVDFLQVLLDTMILLTDKSLVLSQDDILFNRNLVFDRFIREVRVDEVLVELFE